MLHQIESSKNLPPPIKNLSTTLVNKCSEEGLKELQDALDSSNPFLATAIKKIETLSSSQEENLADFYKLQIINCYKLVEQTSDKKLQLFYMDLIIHAYEQIQDKNLPHLLDFSFYIDLIIAAPYNYQKMALIKLLTNFKNDKKSLPKENSDLLSQLDALPKKGELCPGLKFAIANLFIAYGILQENNAVLKNYYDFAMLDFSPQQKIQFLLQENNDLILYGTLYDQLQAFFFLSRAFNNNLKNLNFAQLPSIYQQWLDLSLHLHNVQAIKDIKTELAFILDYLKNKNKNKTMEMIEAETKLRTIFSTADNLFNQKKKSKLLAEHHLGSIWQKFESLTTSNYQTSIRRPLFLACQFLLLTATESLAAQKYGLTIKELIEKREKMQAFITANLQHPKYQKLAEFYNKLIIKNENLYILDVNYYILKKARTQNQDICNDIVDSAINLMGKINIKPIVEKITSDDHGVVKLTLPWKSTKKSHEEEKKIEPAVNISAQPDSPKLSSLLHQTENGLVGRVLKLFGFYSNISQSNSTSPPTQNKVTLKGG